MEIRALRHFVAVAETLSFRRAAERLHIAQPALSQSIKRLEDHLAVQLFERSRSGTALTPAGATALEPARLALLHAEEFDRVAQAAAIGEAGRLRVGFVGSAACVLMPRLLPAYLSRFPTVELVLVESTTRRILKQIEDGELDVGLVRYPILEESHLQLDVIEPDYLVAAVFRDSPLAEQKAIALTDLRNEPFIWFSPSEVPGLHAITLMACQNAGFLPRISQQAVQVQTVVSLVESGLGVALLPSVAHRYAGPNVAFRPLVEGQGNQTIGIALACHARKSSSTVRKFRDVALDFMR